MASILKVNTIQDATNSNTALSIDSSGRITEPNRPAFQASVNSAAWASISTNAIVPFDDVSSNNNFDVGGDFNTSSNRFVVPVTGKYLFFVLIYSFNSDSTNTFRLFVNGSTVKSAGNGDYDFQGGQAGSVDETISGTAILDLTASDYVAVHASTSSDYYGTYSHFGGHLIG